MGSADQLKALLEAHLEGDDQRFISVGMQLAAHEGGEVHSEDVREAMGLDAVKINIGTAISLAIREGARRALDEGLDHYGMLRAMREEVRQVARDKIELMGASVRSRQDATAGV